MPGLRDHEPFVIEEFNGFWDRGNDESCPSDHFIVAENVQYFESGVASRPPLEQYEQGVSGPIRHVTRIYNYATQTGHSLLMLVEGGNIYHVTSPNNHYGPILSIPAMEDFGFVAIAGRAYITPFKTYVGTDGQNYELGLPGEFVYVYKGDGTPARKAAGAAPTNGGLKPYLAFNDIQDGAVTKGIHVVGVAFGDGASWGFGGPIDAGTGTQAYRTINATGNQKLQLNNIPIGPIGTTGRRILLTQAIDPKDYNAANIGVIYSHDSLIIPDNVTTSKIIDIKDADLIAWGPSGPPLGAPFTSALILNNTNVEGFVDTGFHLVAIIYETDTGYLSAPGPEYFAGNTYIDSKKKVQVINIPVSPDPFVKKRHIVSTKEIIDFNGDIKGYQFYFVPKGTLENNTDTTILLSYYDSDLLEDASHLLDNYAAIPAGVALNTYHSRLVLVGDASYPEKTDGTPDTTKPDNRSVARLSAPGEPEAISKVDGLIIAPLDGAPLTNCQEFRDILYLFKKTRTYAYVDNGEVPSTWVEEVLDQGIGAPVHGIATVLDSGGVNTDFLLIVDWSGLMIFNGTYARPEMSWKIEDFWVSLNRNNFRHIQIANDSLNRKLYITLPSPMRQFMLHADYGNGMDAKNIRWSKWVFEANVTSVCLIETNKVMIGAVI